MSAAAIATSLGVDLIPEPPVNPELSRLVYRPWSSAFVPILGAGCIAMHL